MHDLRKHFQSCCRGFGGKHIYEIHNTNKDAILEQLQSANKEDIF